MTILAQFLRSFLKRSAMKRAILFLLFSSVWLAAFPHSVTEENGNYHITHSWKCKSVNQSINLQFDKHLYDYYRQERTHVMYNYMSFILSDYDRVVVADLVDSLKIRNLNQYDAIAKAASFVQSFPYTTDIQSKGMKDYARFPVETLIDGTGDCEDKTILMAAILHELGSDFVLIMFDDHVAVGVNCDGVEAKEAYRHEGKSYFYIETTADNWDIGAIPEQYKDKDAQIIPVATEPMFIVDSVNFESDPTSVFEKAKCKLNLRLRNIGPHCATGLRLHVVMTNEGARKQKVLVDEVFALDDLQEGAERVDKLNFMSYIRESCSLSLELTGDNIADWKEETKLNYYVRSPFGN